VIAFADRDKSVPFHFTIVITTAASVQLAPAGSVTAGY